MAQLTRISPTCIDSLMLVEASRSCFSVSPFSEGFGGQHKNWLSPLCLRRYCTTYLRSYWRLAGMWCCPCSPGAQHWCNRLLPQVHHLVCLLSAVSFYLSSVGDDCMDNCLEAKGRAVSPVPWVAAWQAVETVTYDAADEVLRLQ